MHSLHRRFGWLSLIAFVMLGWPALAFAQGKGHGVEVRAVSPLLEDTTPGRIVSSSFVVTNYSGQEQELRESLQLPEGWNALTPTNTFVLRDAESTTRLVAFQVPRKARAGPHDITYGVQALRDYAIEDAETVTVAVLPLTKLQLLIDEKPQSVISGERFEAKLRLINEGNGELRVRLEVRSQENYPAKIEPAQVTLPAGQSTPLLLTVQTNPKETRPRTLVVGIKARALEMEEGVGAASTTVAVEIIPRVSAKIDPYHRLPVDLTLRAGGEEGSLGAQVEIKGKGALDEEGARHVDFLLRAPSAHDMGSFSEADEYRIKYRDPRGEVRLGDQSYTLSRLTSSWSYGRGLGIDYHPPQQRASFGGYFLEKRWGAADRKEAGLYAGYRVNDKISTQVNFFRKQEDAYRERPATHDTITSLEAQLHPTPDMDLGLEYGTCDSAGRGDSGGDAYRVDLTGRPGRRCHYDLHLTHADPDYYGP